MNLISHYLVGVCAINRNDKVKSSQDKDDENELLHRERVDFYFAGAVAGFARGTGVCFSTWLAVAHSPSRADSEIGVPFALVFMTRRDYAGRRRETTSKDFCLETGGDALSYVISVYQRLKMLCALCVPSR